MRPKKALFSLAADREIAIEIFGHSASDIRRYGWPCGAVAIDGIAARDRCEASITRTRDRCVVSIERAHARGRVVGVGVGSSARGARQSAVRGARCAVCVAWCASRKSRV